MFHLKHDLSPTCECRTKLINSSRCLSRNHSFTADYYTVKTLMWVLACSNHKIKHILHNLPAFTGISSIKLGDTCDCIPCLDLFTFLSSVIPNQHDKGLISVVKWQKNTLLIHQILDSFLPVMGEGAEDVVFNRIGWKRLQCSAADSRFKAR